MFEGCTPASNNGAAAAARCRSPNRSQLLMSRAMAAFICALCFSISLLLLLLPSEGGKSHPSASRGGTHLVGSNVLLLCGTGSPLGSFPPSLSSEESRIPSWSVHRTGRLTLCVSRQPFRSVSRRISLFWAIVIVELLNNSRCLGLGGQETARANEKTGSKVISARGARRRIEWLLMLAVCCSPGSTRRTSVSAAPTCVTTRERAALHVTGYFIWQFLFASLKDKFK